jgi:hypothetical protein
VRWPTKEEFIVIAVVFVGLVLFEMGPKVLNLLKKKNKQS